MNMQLYKTHELFHKHNFKNIGIAVDNGHPYYISKCSCGMFTENIYAHERNERGYLSEGSTPEWIHALAKLVIGLNMVEELLDFINFQATNSNSYYPLEWRKQSKIKLIHEIRQQRREHEHETI